LTGTWPFRSEQEYRQIGLGTNALASSIVLVCRKRSEDAETISRKEFLAQLKQALPQALDNMINGSETSSPVAPVDLAQAAIGPGMAVYSQYKAILEADGQPMSVHTALTLINKAIDEYFKEREGDWDNDTRFCLAWFEQYGFKVAGFGEADVLARAKGISVDGLRDAGVLESRDGKVRLYKHTEYPSDWDPAKDKHLPIWEALHQMIRAHQTSGDELAGKIAAAIPGITDQARQLSFLLYTLCERKGWAEEARPYNEFVTSWSGIENAAEKRRDDFQIEKTQTEFEL
jgi:putative DNA methylase